MFAITSMGGMSHGASDEHEEEAYPNRAYGTMGVGPAYAVLLGGAPAHTISTRLAMSFGAEESASRGKVSGTTMGPVRYLTGASSVLAAGLPVARVSSACLVNTNNARGAFVSPSQTRVVVLAR